MKCSSLFVHVVIVANSVDRFLPKIFFFVSNFSLGHTNVRKLLSSVPTKR